MRGIITPSQVTESVVNIFCGEEQGTGFFVSNDMIVTAYHVVMLFDFDSTKIKIRLLDGTEIFGELLSKNEDFDIAIIKLENLSAIGLPIQSRSIRYNENWESYGFPYSGEANGLRVLGKVNQIKIDQRCDFVLTSESVDSDFDYSGLSGAPVMLSNNVGGIILQQEDDKLLAISISKIKDFLDENEIDFEEEISVLDIPQEFEDDVKTSTPNFGNSEAIDKVLKSSNNWFLFKGSPGSGKTISMVSYLPEDDKVDVVGKYFVKVPNDKMPKALKTTKRYFIQWLEELIYVKLTGTPPPAEDMNFEKKLERLSSLFAELGIYYQSKGKDALIILDGLDEISDLNSFMGIIPVALPDNIKFLLSCTSKEILPSEIKSIISQNETVDAKPINLGQCEAFILREIGDNTIGIENIQEIALKSEGHPLYLRYLVNYIKACNKEELNEIENWLKEIPNIGGDICRYYDSLWDKIFEVPDKLWIVLILSRLRQSIEQDSLIKMLPDQYKFSFLSYFGSLKYLLKGDEYCELYHNSFKDYINTKTYAYSSQSNDFICQFCNLFPNHNYSVNNFLYHQSVSSSPRNAIDLCNQEWADKCALNSVSPELVISDIKGIINVSIDLEQTVDTIRLLLLLQRIEFRYDSVFAENANLIASALISLEEYGAALKYLVRDNTLLVDNYDALSFLQRFYENDAIAEARILFEAISRRYRQLINEGITSSAGISNGTFTLQLNALTLSMNDNFKEGFNGFHGLTQVLKKFEDKASELFDSASQKEFYVIREYTSSWQSAYALRRFDFFIDSEEGAEKTGVKIDEKWAKIRASTIVLYDEIGTYSTGVFQKTENYFSVIKDIENLIENYGYTKEQLDLQILIRALIDESERSDLIKPLIEEYFDYERNFSFRKENGVDINYQEVHELYFEYKCKGYINDIKDLPLIQNTLRYKKWEDFAISVLKNIAFLDGKSQFCKSANLKDDLQETINNYKNVLAKIDFSFDERSHWDRSYQIPEAIYPLIYSKVTNFLAQFSNEELNKFLRLVVRKSQNQLGLYSEGFRKCLFEITSELLRVNHESEEIKSILLIWMDYVVNNVENRWERTSELLKIVEMYGLISDKESGLQVFKEMLNTSMGPSWYKEAQLDLLNTTLDLTNGADELNKYLKEYAALLDCASGEITFQRYVRYEKEVFVGSLIKSGKSDIALEYFKSEVFPSPELIIRNAEKSVFDAPRVGDGYCLGARNIKEQSGVLEILKTIKVDSPYLKWGLAEIFAINDDVFRYVNNYGKIQAQLLSALEKNVDPYIDDFYKTISLIAMSDELKDDRIEYLNCFKSQISETGIRTIQGHLLKSDISWGIVDESPNLDNLKDKESDNCFDIFNNSFDKRSDSKRELLINEGLQAFIKERVNFWLGNWSTSSNDAKSNLKQLFADDSEVFKYLKNNINNYSNETWSITSTLIWFLEGKLSLEKTEGIYKIISEHFSLLIRPDGETIDKYNWIENTKCKNSNDVLLAKFIIWLLNHPNKGYAARAFESINKLVFYEPELIVPVIIEEIISDLLGCSAIKCSLILKELSMDKPQLIVNALEEENNYLNKLIDIKHFTIKKNVLDIAVNLRKIGYVKLYEGVNNGFPETVVLVGDVLMEEDYLELISYKIAELNDMQILNRTFCESLLENIREKCEPLSINDFIKSDKYLTRSFPDEKYFQGRFQEILYYSMNVAITNRVEKSNVDEVYEIINF